MRKEDQSTPTDNPEPPSIWNQMRSTIGKRKMHRRGARKNNHDSIVLRWQNDAKYRESQNVHGWTEDYYRYLEYLTNIDISNSAPWHQRNRYENTILLESNDDDKQAGPTRARKDVKSTTQNLTILRQEPRTTERLYSEERESTPKTIR